MFLVCMCAKLLQLCLTLCDSMNCCLPASSVHGTLQARIPGLVAMPSSRGSSQPRDWMHISYEKLTWLSVQSRNTQYVFSHLNTVKYFLDKAASLSKSFHHKGRKNLGKEQQVPLTPEVPSLDHVWIMINNVSSLYILWLSFNSQASSGPVTIQIQGFIPYCTSDVQRDIGHITSYLVSFSVLIKYQYWSDNCVVYF